MRLGKLFSKVVDVVESVMPLLTDSNNAKDGTLKATPVNNVTASPKTLTLTPTSVENSSHRRQLSSSTNASIQSPVSDSFSFQSQSSTGQNSTESRQPGAREEMKTRRKIAGVFISASMSTGRLLSKVGIVKGEHRAVRRLSRIGVGMGRSEEIAGVTYEKTRIAGVRVRIYSPESNYPLKNKPVIIYLHGGGWVISSTRCYHRFTAELCRDTQTVVISVNYRLAPENPFPAGLEDCLTVTRAVLDGEFDASLFLPHSIDITRVILAGDSAGGNLACATALDLVRVGDYRIFQLLLICPALQAVTLSFPSYKEHGPRQPIGLDWFVPRYAGVKHVTKKLMKAFWRGTHLPPDDRLALSRTVTFGSFHVPGSPSRERAQSLSSQSSNFNDVESEGTSLVFNDNYENENNGSSKFYFEDGDPDSDVEAACSFALSQLDDEPSQSSLTGDARSGCGSSITSPLSPIVGEDFHDQDLSPHAVKVVTDLVKNKRAWPMLADDNEIRFLPPTFIQACECDPLCSENEMFAERMQRSGAVSVRVSVLEKAGHIESLLAERLATKAALSGYQEIVDFIIASHAKLPVGLSPYAENHIFDQVTEYITE